MVDVNESINGTEVTLRWDNFHSNLSNGYIALMEDEDLVDVTISAEGRFIKAHKLVLSVCSPYFKELFKMNPCKHPVVILKDVLYNELEDILQFIYKGEVNIPEEQLESFLKIGESLNIKGLTGHSLQTPFINLPEIEVTSMKSERGPMVPLVSSQNQQLNTTTTSGSHVTLSQKDCDEASVPQMRRKADSLPKEQTSKQQTMEISHAVVFKEVEKSEPLDLGFDVIDLEDDSPPTESTAAQLLNYLISPENAYNEHLPSGSLLCPPVPIDGTTSIEAPHQSNCTPEPTNLLENNKVSYEKLQFIKSSRGWFQLVFDGFVFNRNIIRRDCIYWRCMEYASTGCRARCSTKGNGKLTFNGEHKHVADSKKLINKIFYTLEDVTKSRGIQMGGFEGSSLLGD